MDGTLLTFAAVGVISAFARSRGGSMSLGEPRVRMQRFPPQAGAVVHVYQSRSTLPPNGVWNVPATGTRKGFATEMKNYKPVGIRAPLVTERGWLYAPRSFYGHSSYRPTQASVADGRESTGRVKVAGRWVSAWTGAVTFVREDGSEIVVAVLITHDAYLDMPRIFDALGAS